jgi:hypothetical protein
MSHQYQLGFLQQSMRSNIQIGVLQGIQDLITQWECYSKYYRAFQFQLKALVFLHSSRRRRERRISFFRLYVQPMT